MRIALLYLRHFAKIDFDAAIADEFDVIEAHDALAVPIGSRVARTDIGDGLADGLPHRAAPTGIEGAHDLLAAVGGRGRSQPERIGRIDGSGKTANAQIRRGVTHVGPPHARAWPARPAFHR